MVTHDTPGLDVAALLERINATPYPLTGKLLVPVEANDLRTLLDSYQQVQEREADGAIGWITWLPAGSVARLAADHRTGRTNAPVTEADLAFVGRVFEAIVKTRERITAAPPTDRGAPGVREADEMTRAVIAARVRGISSDVVNRIAMPEADWIRIVAAATSLRAALASAPAPAEADPLREALELIRDDSPGHAINWLHIRNGIEPTTPITPRSLYVDVARAALAGATEGEG
jgi:hypothetical protein